MPNAETGFPAPETIVCIGDSALWCTGTRWEDKAPNIVHQTYQGEPIPPSQFRARGGAIIGNEVDEYNGYYDFDRYGAGDGAEKWYSVYGLRPDENDMNENRWAVARDIGSGHPTILHQLEQFPRDGNEDRQAHEVDVPSVRIDQLGGKPDGTPPVAEDVDLLILNGGTNDIGLEWMNNPLEANRLSLWFNTKVYCYDDLSYLIHKSRERFPNATIAVVGYPPFTSHQTDRDAAKRFLDEYMSRSDEIGYRALDVLADWAEDVLNVDVKGQLAEVAIQNGLDFARFQSYWMRRAVAEADRTDRRAGNPGILFVARGFGLINSMEAQDAWCWGSPPQDDMRAMRTPACVHDGDPPELSCLWAAIGHPNREGNRQTADQIESRYEDYERAAVGERIVEIGTARFERDPTSSDGPDPLPVSVRETLDRYDLDPEDGLRYCHSHTTVDSIRVTFESGVVSAFVLGRTFPQFMPTVDLVVEPGRSGDRELYRLSNTYRPPELLEDISNTVDDVQGVAEFISDALFGGIVGRLTDNVEDAVGALRDDLEAEGVDGDDGKWLDFGFEHYDRFQPRSTDTICIDPMHGRYIEEYKGFAMAHHAPSSVRPGADWSAEPLRLEHVQSAELHVDLENWPGIHRIREFFEEYGEPLIELLPEGHPVRELLEELMDVETIWELHEVTLELNGHMSTTIDVGEVTETTTIDLGFPGG